VSRCPRSPTEKTPWRGNSSLALAVPEVKGRSSYLLQFSRRPESGIKPNDAWAYGSKKIEPSRSCGVLPGLARRRREMIEFLIQMPTATMMFLASAVLSLAATLIVLSR
jgi:hypothetical protein